MSFRLFTLHVLRFSGSRFASHHCRTRIGGQGDAGEKKGQQEHSGPQLTHDVLDRASALSLSLSPVPGIASQGATDHDDDDDDDDAAGLQISSLARHQA